MQGVSCSGEGYRTPLQHSSRAGKSEWLSRPAANGTAASPVHLCRALELDRYVTNVIRERHRLASCAFSETINHVTAQCSRQPPPGCPAGLVCFFYSPPVAEVRGAARSSLPRLPDPDCPAPPPPALIIREGLISTLLNDIVTARYETAAA